jgi:hypothetical protein
MDKEYKTEILNRMRLDLEESLLKNENHLQTLPKFGVEYNLTESMVEQLRMDLNNLEDDFWERY